MSTTVLSAIIVSIVVTAVFLLPLVIVAAIIVVVPPERLAAFRRLFTHRRALIEDTKAITDVVAVPAPASPQPEADTGQSNVSDASRGPHRLGYFVIETAHLERTRLLVETFLDRETKSWRLDGSTGYPRALGRTANSGVARATLLYLVRFRRRSNVETVRDRLKAVGESSDFTVRLECDDDLIARSA